jgi:hypothetical protein
LFALYRIRIPKLAESATIKDIRFRKGLKMIRRDYILQMIERMARALARIREQIAEGQFEEARPELDEAFQELIGMGPEKVSQLTETQLLAKLTQDEPTLIVEQKTGVLIALLEQAGALHAAQGREEERDACLIKALDLLLAMQLRDYNFEMPGFVPSIEGLRLQLSDVALPMRTQAGLWRHYEKIGSYGKAEDALFAILEAEPANANLLSEARAFYERLLRQSDSHLEEGGLPRAEVEAGLAEVRALSAA